MSLTEKSVRLNSFVKGEINKSDDHALNSEQLVCFCYLFALVSIYERPMTSLIVFGELLYPARDVYFKLRAAGRESGVPYKLAAYYHHFIERIVRYSR